MGLLGEISVTITVFILGFFPRKTNKIFQVIPKTLFWGTLWAFFSHIWTKMNFPGKKGSISFFTFHISTTMQKIRKKLMSHSREKSQTDR